MFTGIVEEVGRVAAVDRSPGGLAVRIHAPLTAAGLTVGASVSVNGACLTAVAVDDSEFLLDLVPETLDRTNLGTLVVGAEVNLELAMPAAGRFDGHIVQGHVDGVGVVEDVAAEGDGRRLTVSVPEPLRRYVVEKGSVTIDGVSLTVAGISGADLQVALIPHTLAMTTLGSRTVGDRVNLETDVLAKYVERLVKAT